MCYAAEVRNYFGTASNNKSNPLFNTACGYTDEETPCSISNQEAKLVLADDTLPYWDVGKVGRRGLCFLCFYTIYSLVLYSVF